MALRLVSFVTAAMLAVSPVLAQETAPTPSLALELNALTASETGCRVTFLATNKLGTEVTRSAF